MIFLKKFRELSLNVIIFGVGSISVKLVLFLVMPLLTIYLSTEEYGLFDTLLSITDLLVPIITLGLVDSVFRFSLDKKYIKSEIFSSCLFLNIIMFLCLALVIFIIYQFFSETYIILLLPLIMSFSLKNMIGSFVRGLDKSLIFAFGSILQSVVLILFSIIFLVNLKLGFFGYIFANIIANSITILFLLCFSSPLKNLKFKSINKNLTKKMLLYSLPAIPNMISWWFVQTTSKYLAIYFVGLSAASIYMAATKLPSIINTFSIIFLNAWSLSSTKVYKDNDRDVYYQSVFDVYKILIFFGITFTIFLTPFLSKFLLQGEFYSGWIYTPFLVIAAGLGCFSIFFGTFFVTFYKNKREMISTLIGSIFNIIISIALMSFIGIWGAAIGTLISYLIITVIRIVLCRDLIKIKIKPINLTLNLLTILIYACFFSFIELNLQFTIYVTLIVFFLLFIININFFKKMYTLFKLHRRF